MRAVEKGTENLKKKKWVQEGFGGQGGKGKVSKERLRGWGGGISLYGTN